jgi:hypothetical protein
LLAADVVDVLGEYVVGARLPLTDRRDLIAPGQAAAAGAGVDDLELSLGVWSEQTVLSMSVVAHAPALSRPARGVLLMTRRPGLRWAFEIDGAIGFVDVDRVSAPGGIPWRRQATLSAGQTVPYIDVPALMRELAVPAAAGQAGRVQT